jgi:hypothetical protein
MFSGLAEILEQTSEIYGLNSLLEPQRSALDLRKAFQ